MKTVFTDGMILTPEFMNRVNNPVYKEHPSEDGEIPISPILPKSVKDSSIDSRAVTSDHIADAAVLTEHIRDGAITQQKLAYQSVGHAELQADAVKADTIAFDAIYPEALQQSAVTSRAIAEEAVESRHVMPNSIEGRHINKHQLTKVHVKPGFTTSTTIETVDASPTTGLSTVCALQIGTPTPDAATNVTRIIQYAASVILDPTTAQNRKKIEFFLDFSPTVDGTYSELPGTRSCIEVEFTESTFAIFSLLPISNSYFGALPAGFVRLRCDSSADTNASKCSLKVASFPF